MNTDDSTQAPSLAAPLVTALLGGQGCDERPRWHDTTSPGGGGAASGRGSAADVSVGRGSDVPGGCRPSGGSTSDPWPTWARAQLLDAVDCAAWWTGPASVPDLAEHLRRTWFRPAVAASDLDAPRQPLVGVYRAAHAGGARPLRLDGLPVVNRDDVIGPDGRWRTWGPAWQPTLSRSRSIRVLFSPRRDAVPLFVRAVTANLVPTSLPWMLSCPTTRNRFSRAGAVVLSLPDVGALSEPFLAAVARTLDPVTPALCEPVAPGIALCRDPGPEFAARRCAAVASALLDGTDDPLAAIAAAFRSARLDPQRPDAATASRN